jgi:hypothetical protein
MKKSNYKSGASNPVLSMPKGGEKLKALNMPKGKKDYIVPDAVCK